MKKLIGFMFITMFSFVVIAEQYTYRTTSNGIEYLLTANPDEGWVCLERAITLTADNYDMVIDLQSIVPYDADYTDVKIGASAFEGNEYITSIWIYHEPWTPKLTICDNAFKNCIRLTEMFFPYASEENPDPLVSIGKSAFEGCGQIFSQNPIGGPGMTGHAITNIGERAFYKCYANIFGELCLDSIQHIGADAFNGYGARAYYQDTYVKLPSSYANIGAYAFSGDSLEYNNSWSYGPKVLFPESLQSIGAGAFYEYRASYRNRRIGETYNERSYDLVIPNGTHTISNSAFWGSSFRSLRFPSSLKHIGEAAFRGTTKYVWGETLYSSSLQGDVIIPESVVSIGDDFLSGHPDLEKIVFLCPIEYFPTICDCDNLKEVIVPPSVKFGIESEWCFSGCTNLRLIFEGLPPSRLNPKSFNNVKEVLIPMDYKSQWNSYLHPNMKFAKKVNGEWVALGGKVISNAMRPSDPTIMDIKYKVTSTKDKVDVRLLAFQDGNRSFAKVLRPETFVEGTEANVGNGVAANVEHTVSWQVSKDWDVDLAKVSIEVYVKEDNLLPLSLTTIPAMGERAAVTFSRNEPDSEKVMNALYWLYADKAADLTLANGVLKCGDAQLVNGSSLSAANAVSYIYSKMGYGTLSGDTLNYVNGLTRLGLSPNGIKQYAVKEGAAE